MEVGIERERKGSEGGRRKRRMRTGKMEKK